MSKIGTIRRVWVWVSILDKVVLIFSVDISSRSRKKTQRIREKISCLNFACFYALHSIPGSNLRTHRCGASRDALVQMGTPAIRKGQGTLTHRTFKYNAGHVHRRARARRTNPEESVNKIERRRVIFRCNASFSGGNRDREIVFFCLTWRAFLHSSSVTSLRWLKARSHEPSLVDRL